MYILFYMISECKESSWIPWFAQAAILVTKLGHSCSAACLGSPCLRGSQPHPWGPSCLRPLAGTLDTCLEEVLPEARDCVSPLDKDLKEAVFLTRL